MIESARAFDFYFRAMLVDFNSIQGGHRAVDGGAMAEFFDSIPVLIQTLRHYRTAKESFMRTEKTLPRIKEIVLYYEKIIDLLDAKFVGDKRELINLVYSKTGHKMAYIQTNKVFETALKELREISILKLLIPLAPSYVEDKLKACDEAAQELFRDHRERINLQRHTTPNYNGLFYQELLDEWNALVDTYWIAKEFNAR